MRGQTVTDQFLSHLNSDLDTPAALALVWEAIKNRAITKKELFKFDKIFGLQIKEHLEKPAAAIPADVQSLVDAHNTARTNKDWSKSDELRKELESLGYEVKDTPDGTKVTKK